MGVPMIGCECPVCRSDDPNNKRLRPSALITIGEKRLVIDTGPDFRTQALTHGIDHIDGVILTHTHFDHVAGLDELRTFYILKREVTPILASGPSHSDLKKRYGYFFREKTMGVSLSAQLHFQVLEGERGETRFLNLPIKYMTYRQGGMAVNGYRFGDLAYVSDIHDFPETIFEDLKGVKTLVLDALRDTPSPMHFSLEEAIAFSKRAGAKKTFFTHIGHELEHQATNASLPKGFALAHDGLKLEFSIDV